MAERTCRDLATFWRKHFPVESGLSDERLVLRILRENPLFGHELADLPGRYGQAEPAEHETLPLRAEWSDAQWHAVLEQWREAVEMARTLPRQQPLRRPSGIPIPLAGRRVGAVPSSRMLAVPVLLQEQTLWCWCACCATWRSMRGPFPELSRAHANESAA